LQLADRVLQEGTAGFLGEMLSNRGLLSPTTRTNRPDIVDAALRMMQSMSAEDIAQVQRGMAERPDSVATLATITVPTLLIAGSDDNIPLSEFELMRQQIRGSRLQIIPQAGHYAALEKPAEFATLLRTFFDGLARR
jgi:3-oxoadipate enol-lactonase